MMEDLKKTFLEEISAVNNLSDLSNLRVKYLGRKGIITDRLKSLSALPHEERPLQGKKINEIKEFIEADLDSKESRLKQEELKKQLLSDSVDVTLSGKFVPFGRQHPINKVLSEITDIFVKMGFSVEEGPEVELDYYNFEALNIPKDHPARDMQDTFYISDDIVLRTHTIAQYASDVHLCRGLRKREKARPEAHRSIRAEHLMEKRL